MKIVFGKVPKTLSIATAVAEIVGLLTEFLYYTGENLFLFSGVLTGNC
jgi:hypothetical protein